MSEPQHVYKIKLKSRCKRATAESLGPTHPATHGVFQNILEIDGERALG